MRSDVHQDLLLCAFPTPSHMEGEDNTTNHMEGEDNTMQRATQTEARGTKMRRNRLMAVVAVSLPVLVALVAALAFPATGWAVEEDTKPPEVKAMSVSPAEVDVTAESKTVTVTATIEDPAGPGEVSSGVRGGSIEYRAPGNEGFGGCPSAERACGTFVKKSGEEWTATVQVPKFAKPGTWAPHVFVVDNAGAFREYTAAQLKAEGFKVEVEVKSTPDTTPPEITEVKVGPPTAVTVSPPNGPQSVPAEATATDDLTGVSSVFIIYGGPGGKHHAFGFLAHKTGNQFAGNITFQPYQEAGKWSATEVQATDGAGNTQRVVGAQLAALKLPQIEVTSSPVDLEPPKLVSLAASAETPCPEGVKGACVDAQKAEQKVTLKATVSDDLSGVTFVSLAYGAPEDGHILPLFVSLQKKSGEEWEGTVTVPRLSKAGNWKPLFLELSDGAGNFKGIFEPKELEKEISQEAWIHVSRVEKIKEVKPGEKVSTGEKTSETNPIQTQLTVPPGGTGGEVTLEITPRTTEPPSGFYLLEQQLNIQAPTQPDASHPLTIEFLVDASVFKSNPQVQFPPGCIAPGPGMPPPECTLTVFKNGVAVPTCSAVPPAAISPNPCIVSPQEKVGSETKLTIYSTTASAWNVGIPVAQGVTPEPTETTTSLSGGGHSGGTITVPEGTAVTDNATLSGTNVSKAEGKVSYKVYSDKECTKEATSAGEVEVAGGKVPPSNAKTLAPGTYYWQASYGGDEENAKSKSTCGSEIETVEEGKPVSTPRLAKDAVLAKLEALVPSGNRDADHRIAEAVRDIKESLDPKLWIDDSHLTAKKGEHVFQEEREAVQHLRHIKGPAAGAVAGLVAELVEIDRTLAQTAIDEATDPRSIAKATTEMAKAAEELAEGEPNNAIEHYKQAWKVATKA